MIADPTPSAFDQVPALLRSLEHRDRHVQHSRPGFNPSRRTLQLVMRAKALSMRICARRAACTIETHLVDEHARMDFGR